MVATLAALSPVLAGLAAGVALRRTGTAKATHGRFLLLVNLYLCMPALALVSLASVPLTATLAVFPAAAAMMVGVGYVVGRIRGRGLPPAERSVVLMGLMVVNCAFALPFVEALHGAAGVARLMAFDVVNNFLVLTVVHALAAGASPLREARRSPFVQVLRTPPLHALLLGVALNLTGTPLPALAEQVLRPFAAASPVLIALGTGVLYAPSRAMLRRAGALALARITLGVTVAALVVAALGLDGVDRDVLLLLGVAPLGFVIVTFSAHHRLDTDLATEALGLSLAASLALSLAISLSSPSLADSKPSASEARVLVVGSGTGPGAAAEHRPAQRARSRARPIPWAATCRAASSRARSLREGATTPRAATTTPARRTGTARELAPRVISSCVVA